MAATEDRHPSLIASHVDVIYRVYGARKVGTVSGAPGNAGLARLLRGRGSVGGVREVHAVKDVSFVAYHGESIGIVGRNGSGKSTLLRALAGLIPPTRGAVYTAGRASLLGVNAVLMRELSGERNVMIGGQALGLTPREVREKMDEIVSFAGLEDFIDLPMKAYSSGMAARLRFAISTAAVPEILMVDEALATGDSEFRARSQERIAEIREAAGTVFLVSHSASTVRAICDRALWLDEGRLVMDGPAEEVVDAYAKSRGPRRSAKKPPAKKAPAKKAPVEDSPGGGPSAEGSPAATSTAGKPAENAQASSAAGDPSTNNAAKKVQNQNGPVKPPPESTERDGTP